MRIRVLLGSWPGMMSVMREGVGVILWSGHIGGAETFALEAVREMRRRGTDARFVFVLGPGDLRRSLEEDGIPFTSLGLVRGRHVLLHSRTLARHASEANPSVAWLVEGGYLAAALRIGGYGGRIVATEHGRILEAERLPPVARAIRRIDRASGTRFLDVEVAVSDFVAKELLQHPHARAIVRIYNGVDLSVFKPSVDRVGLNRDPMRQTPLRVGCAGRLVPEKRVDDLLHALARADGRPITVRVAGDGPERPRLATLSQSLRVEERVEFCGWVRDMAKFWNDCDLAVVPSIMESFSMVAAEAMACGVPVLAYRTGGLPEIVRDGVSGTIVDGGDVEALARGIVGYLEHPEVRTRHSRDARRWCEERYDLRNTVEAYLELFADLTRS